MRLLPLLAALLLGSAAARAQAPAAPSPALEELRRLCQTISMSPADGREMARRAECVLAGVLPSPSPLAEARSMAKSAMAAGEPSGGIILYLAFQADPANQATRDGKPDPEAYRRLAARPLGERQLQVDAIEGLGFAAGRNHIPAGLLLAGHFHDTVAPRNIARLGAIAALLMRLGEKGPMVERYAREADAIARSAGDTKASARAFFATYQAAESAARGAYEALAGGKRCEKPLLKTVSSGELQDAEFLPLQGTLVKDSYLVRGHWTEYWNFDACGEEVPLKVAFAADGWGGATSTVRLNKGD